MYYVYVHIKNRKLVNTHISFEFNMVTKGYFFGGPKELLFLICIFLGKYLEINYSSNYDQFIHLTEIFSGLRHSR